MPVVLLIRIAPVEGAVMTLSCATQATGTLLWFAKSSDQESARFDRAMPASSLFYRNRFQ
jgi:hypothetical protein